MGIAIRQIRYGRRMNGKLIVGLDREQPNLREALEFCVSDHPDIGLQMAGSLY